MKNESGYSHERADEGFALGSSEALRVARVFLSRRENEARRESARREYLAHRTHRAQHADALEVDVRELEPEKIPLQERKR